MKRAIIGPERTADPTVPVRVVYAPMLEQCHEPQTVVSPLVRASLALHNEGALLPFLAGDITPVDVMYRLSGVSGRRQRGGWDVFFFGGLLADGGCLFSVGGQGGGGRAGGGACGSIYTRTM